MNRKEKTILVSIILNIILTVGKLILSNISGSNALIADAWHSFSDVLVSGIVLLGLLIIRFIDKKSESLKKIPSLETKRKRLILIENIVALIIGTFILGLSFSLLQKVFFSSEQEHILHNIPIAILGQIILIGLTYFLYKYKNIIGNEEDSAGIVADSFHTKADMFSSIGVLIALIGYFINLDLDNIAALIIFFIVFYTGIEIIIKAIKSFKSKNILVLLKPIKMKLQVVNKISAYINTFYNVIKTNKIKSTLIFFIIISLIYFSFGFYTVNQDERAVKVFLGKLEKKEIQPGLHFEPFYPLTEIIKVNTLQSRIIEVGFQTNFYDNDENQSSDILIYQWESTHISNQYTQKPEELTVLTGDGNIINVNYIVEYNIKNIKKFLFNVNDPEYLLSELIDSIARSEFSKYKMFSCLLSERCNIELNLKKVLQEKLDEYNTGINIIKVMLFDIHPEIQVIGSYRRVNNEEEYKKIKIYEAEAYRSTHIPYTKGLIYEIKQNAIAKANEIIKEAKRDIETFNALSKAYQNEKDEIKFRLVIEAISKNLLNKNKIVIFEGVPEEKIKLNFMKLKPILK